MTVHHRQIHKHISKSLTINNLCEKSSKEFDNSSCVFDFVSSDLCCIFPIKILLFATFFCFVFFVTEQVQVFRPNIIIQVAFFVSFISGEYFLFILYTEMGKNFIYLLNLKFIKSKTCHATIDNAHQEITETLKTDVKQIKLIV